MSEGATPVVDQLREQRIEELTVREKFGQLASEINRLGLSAGCLLDRARGGPMEHSARPVLQGLNAALLWAKEAERGK
jgi:hypothetical protein